MFIGRYNKFGDVPNGRAVVDKLNGDTIYKMNGQPRMNAIVLETLSPRTRAMFSTVAFSRDVTVLSEKLTELIKREILSTPGYKGLLL